MDEAAVGMRFEEAASLRDLLHTVEEMEQKQKMASAEGDDTDIYAFYAGRRWSRSTCSTCGTAGSLIAASSSGKTRSSSIPPNSSSLIKQIYLEQQYVPRVIHVPVDFEDREPLEEVLSEKRGRKVEIHTPQRGQKKAMLALVETNAKHSFDQRFRVLKPTSKAIAVALQDALNLSDEPRRIECFDIRISRAPTRSPAWWSGKTAG